MYDPNKPIWLATFAEIKDFLQEVGMMQQTEQVVTHCNRSKGLHNLCTTLGINRNKVLALKEQGIFKGAVFQEVKGGTLTFDPEAAKAQYAAYCNSQTI